MNRMVRCMPLGIALLAIVLTPISGRAQESLAPLLQPYLAQCAMPALAAAVVKNGRIIASGAVGTRKYGENIPVTINDKFHLGSDTKAMTALLAAMLVERGKLHWNSTIGEVFSELASGMDPVFKSLTVEQMLSHTSGLPSDNLSKDSEPYIKLMIDIDSYPPGNLDEIRYWLVSKWSKLPMSGKPLAKFEYSNLNYVIVGAMIEKIEGKSWDELMFAKIFRPLNLRTAGLGMQSSIGKIDAPLPHATVDGKIKPMLAGPFADNPLVIGPAGIAHMSVLDFARWAGWNAGRGKRGPNLVKPETMKKLQTAIVSMPLPEKPQVGTPSGGKYALGWGEMIFDYSPNPIIIHAGSNGMNFALIEIDPEKDFAVVVLTNVASPKSSDGARAIVKILFEKYEGK
jgi:CubicO group peptidase (beta-lactamase class C family)